MEPLCIARRMRCNINHAVFCVTPIARCSSYELMPFLQLDASHIAGSHLSKPIGESSKIVPTLAENFCFGCGVRHFQTFAFSRNVTLSEPQRGQRTPLGQRIPTKNLKAFSGLLKY